MLFVSGRIESALYDLDGTYGLRGKAVLSPWPLSRTVDVIRKDSFTFTR